MDAAPETTKNEKAEMMFKEWLKISGRVGLGYTVSETTDYVIEQMRCAWNASHTEALKKAAEEIREWAKLLDVLASEDLKARIGAAYALADAIETKLK
ncbi:MAG: hypothetical protein QME66_08175 [Candidatus Eisenbacteria bacterium]|nr:hypothetical protein [Candidatus Eisenbacteria bacterium]